MVRSGRAIHRPERLAQSCEYITVILDARGSERPLETANWPTEIAHFVEQDRIRVPNPGGALADRKLSLEIYKRGVMRLAEASAAGTAETLPTRNVGLQTDSSCPSPPADSAPSERTSASRSLGVPVALGSLAL
jgi:hypothetical protein